MLGPLFWNIYFDDILHLIPEAQAYADDCTLSFPCKDNNHYQTIIHINEALKTIVSWGKKWQVTLASEKTQLMVISRRLRPNNLPQIKIDGEYIIPQSRIDILGIQFDQGLTFTDHVKDLAKRTAQKFACLRRVAHLLDSKGCSMLYNSQIRSLMEYAPLVWSSCPRSYLRLLDKVQERAQRLVNNKRHEEQQVNFQSLQHRRAVSGMCVLYKVQVKGYPQLADLRLPPALRPARSTRQANVLGSEVAVPFARTELFIRSFHPYYARMWNRLCQNVSPQSFTSLHNFKCFIHNYLKDNPNFFL